MISAFRATVRSLSSAASRTAGELRLSELLQKQFPQAQQIVVNDVSNGCGSMYQIMVESVEFKGMTKVAQHKAITNTLKEEIKDMHGLVIDTKVVKN